MEASLLMQKRMPTIPQSQSAEFQPEPLSPVPLECALHSIVIRMWTVVNQSPVSGTSCPSPPREDWQTFISTPLVEPYVVPVHCREGLPDNVGLMITFRDWVSKNLRGRGTSLMVQWLRLCTSNRGPRFDHWSGN